MEAQYKICGGTGETPAESLQELTIAVDEQLIEGFYPTGGVSVFMWGEGWSATQAVFRERQS